MREGQSVSVASNTAVAEAIFLLCRALRNNRFGTPGSALRGPAHAGHSHTPGTVTYAPHRPLTNGSFPLPHTRSVAVDAFAEQASGELSAFTAAVRQSLSREAAEVFPQAALAEPEVDPALERAAAVRRIEQRAREVQQQQADDAQRSETQQQEAQQQQQSEIFAPQQKQALQALQEERQRVLQQQQQQGMATASRVASDSGFSSVKAVAGDSSQYSKASSVDSAAHRASVEPKQPRSPAPASPAPAAPAPAAPAAPAAPKLRILCIDDEPVNVKLMQRMLNLTGRVEVTTGADGKDLVELVVVQGRQFDCVVMDQNMREMNGTEAAHKVREHEKKFGLKPLPILITSGNNSEAEQREYAAAGTDGVVRARFHSHCRIACVAEASSPDPLVRFGRFRHFGGGYVAPNPPKLIIFSCSACPAFPFLSLSRSCPSPWTCLYLSPISTTFSRCAIVTPVTLA